MKIPYFSMITTPGSLIVFICLLLFGYCLSLMAYIAIEEKTPTWWVYTKILVVPIAMILVVWILIGDSTQWSKPFGLWLRGK